MASASIAMKTRNFGLGFRMAQARLESFLAFLFYMYRGLGDLPSILDLSWRWEDGRELALSLDVAKLECFINSFTTERIHSLWVLSVARMHRCGLGMRVADL